MDAVNLSTLIFGVLFTVSIIATLFAARFGAHLLLIFLLMGMLSGEAGSKYPFYEFRFGPDPANVSIEQTLI
ncbi:MAG: hypothetical protein E6Q75_10655 [Rheinheimera sp.]|nr:MAG: hypothetical protein E6Q75_10655 [Rheinheimera sp.]